MRQHFANKKLFSLLGITLIIFGIVLTTFLTQRTNILQGDASVNEDPKNISVTNATDTSFTIVYTTSKPSIGEVNLGEDSKNLSQKFLDDRNVNSQEINSFTSHSISVNNLKADTNYFYLIKSGNKKITDNGKPFTFKTGPKIDNSSENRYSIQGKVIYPDDNTNDGIVLLKLKGSNQISSFIKNGNFNLPLNKLLTEDLKDYFKIEDNSILNMEIRSGNLSSSIKLSENQKSPLPVITLSNNYDFIEIIPTPTKVSASKDTKFPGFKSKLKTIQDPSIIFYPTKSPTKTPIR